MKCPYCKASIEYKQKNKSTIWKAWCLCVTVEHRFLERAIRLCIAAAYKKNCETGWDIRPFNCNKN